MPVARMSAPRLPSLGTFAFWIALVSASLGLIVGDLLQLRGVTIGHEAMLGRDFLNAWAGGTLAWQGRVTEIYAIHDYWAAIRGLTGEPLVFHAFSYPPTLLLILWPFGLVPYLPALLLWLTASGGAFLMTARSYMARAGLPVWLPLLVPASIVNIWGGHFGFAISALWLAGFAALPEKPGRAGLYFALLTLKPHMGVMIALVLLLRGAWRTIAVASVAAAALVGLSVLAFGSAAWIAFFEVTAPFQASLLGRKTGAYLAMMPTPYMSFKLASGPELAWIVHGLFAAAAIALVVRAALSEMAWRDLGLVAATATFVVLPYAFNYDMMLVGIAAAAMLLNGRARPLGWAEMAWAVLALAAPILVFELALLSAPILPVALLAFLYMQVKAYLPAGSPGPSPARQQA